jgi:hypothetical protein
MEQFVQELWTKALETDAVQATLSTIQTILILALTWITSKIRLKKAAKLEIKEEQQSDETEEVVKEPVTPLGRLIWQALDSPKHVDFDHSTLWLHGDVAIELVPEKIIRVVDGGVIANQKEHLNPDDMDLLMTKANRAFDMAKQKARETRGLESLRAMISAQYPVVGSVHHGRVQPIYPMKYEYVVQTKGNDIQCPKSNPEKS